jgi:hypothetical protein
MGKILGMGQSRTKISIYLMTMYILWSSFEKTIIYRLEFNVIEDQL